MNVLVCGAILAGSLPSCSDPASNTSFRIASYPLREGNEWTYSFIAFQITNGSEMKVWEETTVRVHVESVKDTAVRNAARLRIEYVSDSTMYETMWYSVTGSEMTEIGYSGGILGLGDYGLPKRGGMMRHDALRFMLLTGLAFGNEVQSYPVSVDSLVLRDYPRVVYRFPLEEGKEWISFPQPMQQKKIVLAPRVVVVGGEKMTAAVIKTIFPEFEDAGSEYLDYVTSKGLVRRTFIATAVIGEPGHPETADTVYSEIRSELISTNVRF